MIKVAIIGYGNIGKATVSAIESSRDMELVGIVSQNPLTKKIMEPSKIQVVEKIEDMTVLPQVAILCIPTLNIEKEAVKYLELGINTVDSFDMHKEIYKLKTKLGDIAKKSRCVAMVSAGWDPGTDSVIRGLLEVMAPKGITYSNFGTGMSMGHSTVVKGMDDVIDAVSLTVPTGCGIHRRLVYVKAVNGADTNQIKEKILHHDYFKSDETVIFFIDNVDRIKDFGHGVHMVRKGVSGETHNQNFEFNMKIQNPALTAQIMVSAARASVKQNFGAYTLIEIPVIDLLEGDKEKLINSLV